MELCPSLWYVDVIENIEYDEEGSAVYVDKYLDVIFSPEGDIKVDDRDELDAAKWCAEVRKIAEQKMEEGYKPMYLFHGSTMKYNRLEPRQAHGACEKESMMAIYAAESLRDVIPFALPLRWYPDGPEGKKSFYCDAGKTYVEYGYVDLNRDGYGYRRSR